MLQNIREHTQGWLAGTIISIIILSFALWGIHSYFVGSANNNIVATVNNVDITSQELATTYQRLRHQVLAQYGAGAITANNESILKAQALKALIDMQVLHQAARKHGFYISEQQIENYLQALPEFQENGQFSLKRLQQILANLQLSDAAFIKLIKTSLLIEQPKMGIAFSSFALPNQTQSAIKLLNQERDLAYIKIPVSYFENGKLTIPQADILTYYDNHKKEFITPEQVSIEYIELTQDEISKTLHPSEADLKQYFEQNASTYLSEPTWKYASLIISSANKDDKSMQNLADTIYQKANSEQANLSALAKEFRKRTNYQISFTQPSKPLTQLQMPAYLQTAIKSIQKNNVVVEPIKTNKGYEIVKVIAYTPAKPVHYEQVKDKVKKQYLQQKSEENFADLKEQLANLTYENPNSLNSAAKELNLPIKTSDYFSKEKPGPGIAQFKKLRNAAFSEDVLMAKNNSDVIMLNNSHAVVIRIKDHVATSFIPLNAVVNSIEKKLKRELGEKETEKLAKLILQKLQSGAEREAVALAYKLKWQNTGFLGRYATKVDNAILDMAFSLPAKLTNNNIQYGITRLADGYAIVALKGVHDGKIDEKQISTFAEQVQNNDGLLEYELYKQSQINNAKVSVKS